MCVCVCVCVCLCLCLHLCAYKFTSIRFLVRRVKNIVFLSKYFSIYMIQ